MLVCFYSQSAATPSNPPTRYQNFARFRLRGALRVEATDSTEVEALITRSYTTSAQSLQTPVKTLGPGPPFPSVLWGPYAAGAVVTLSATPFFRFAAKNVTAQCPKVHVLILCFASLDIGRSWAEYVDCIKFTKSFW
jgi:hypothetical protein